MLGANFMKTVIKAYIVFINEMAVEIAYGSYTIPILLTFVALIGYNKLLARSTALLLNAQRICLHRDVMQNYLQ